MFVYILECIDGSYYVGSTRNLDERIRQHQAGEGAVYTRRRRPVRLVFVQEFQRIDEAYAMEKRVQGWSRAKRQALIAGALNELPRLSRKDFSAIRPGLGSGG
jgi:predicted GIY-YIG superfamily endonuclease